MTNAWQQFFKDKRVTLMGLGLLGRSIGDAVFLAECGANILVTDKKGYEELAPSVKKLKKYPNVQFALGPAAAGLGGHELKDFSNADMILKAAGVPLDSPYIKEARKHKIPVYMSTALFVKLLPPGVIVIGITGTRGKTTTTHLIHEILIQHTTYNIQHTKQNVFLGGNVQGISTLAMLPKIKFGDFIVLELDSWQLQGFGDLKISPHIAVFTNFLADHLNYYGTMERYFRDKANIFKYQEPDTNTRMRANDPSSRAKLATGHGTNKKFIVGGQAVPFVKKWEPGHARRTVVARAGDVPKNWKLKIKGEHNRANIACAVAVADVLKIPRGITKKAVENFRGVPGRLELVRKVRGVKIYNDTTATTPDATIAALRALARDEHGTMRGGREKRHANILQNVSMSVKQSEREKMSIVLIMGGADKGLDMKALVREIPKYCKAVVLLSGTGTERFATYNIQHTTYKTTNAKMLKEALLLAMDNADKGDTVLFSPAFASFGMFKNEYDRGEQFVKLVRRFSTL